MGIPIMRKREKEMRRMRNNTWDNLLFGTS
jgi:hypothetical protein